MRWRQGRESSRVRRGRASIGDDRLMCDAGRDAASDSFTHGSSEQRMRWLRADLEAGQPDACDTFGRAGG